MTYSRESVKPEFIMNLPNKVTYEVGDTVEVNGLINITVTEVQRLLDGGEERFLVTLEVDKT